MRIEGRWLAGADGVERPVFDGIIVTQDGRHLALSLLVDTGADLTVLAPAVAEQLADNIQPTPTETVVGGVGGTQQVYELAVDLLLPTTGGQRARVRGPLPVLSGAGIARAVSYREKFARPVHAYLLSSSEYPAITRSTRQF